jgi:hypothetical protein
VFPGWKKQLQFTGVMASHRGCLKLSTGRSAEVDVYVYDVYGQG